MSRWTVRAVFDRHCWEPALYRFYYRLPLLSYRRKRLLILFLHRYLGFLTRHTESYRHFGRTGPVGEERPSPLLYHDGSRNYRAWLRRCGRTRRLARSVRALARRPLISLLVPAADCEARWLERVVADLRGQPYAEWELLSATPLPETGDTRIHRPAATVPSDLPALAARARGEYVALLEPGTRLAADTLYQVAGILLDRPTADLLFGDEDRIDARGRRSEPYFKSGWHPDTALDHDLIGGFAMYRRALLARPGASFAGGNHGLFLRLSEELPIERIVHLTRILHHRDAAMTCPAPLEPVREALRRRGVAARVEPSPLLADAVRIRHVLPQPAPRVSLIIPTRNGVELLGRCIDGVIERTDYPDIELIVVDNGSDDPATLDYLAALPRLPLPVRVLRDPRPFNYSQLNNSAVAVATGELIGLLNNDIEVIDGGWLGEMVGLALQPGVGAVGARLLYPDGRLQHAGVMVGFGGLAGHVPRGQPPDESFQRGWTRRLRGLTAVTAACLVMRRAIYTAVGGLDEVDLPVTFNDVDLCLRLRKAGYRVLCTPFATLYHHESATRGPEHESPDKAARAAREAEVLRTRWHTDDFEDPAFGPNLSRYHEAGAYAFPPRYRLHGGNESQ